MAVFAVDEHGGTGDQIGWATLVEPAVALVLRPSNQDLAAAPRPLRTGIRRTADVGVEVIDVAGLHVLDDDRDVVVLTLARESLTAPSPIPTSLVQDPFDPFVFHDPSRAEVVAALRAVLDSVAAPPDPVLGVDDPMRFIRRVLGLHP